MSNGDGSSYSSGQGHGLRQIRQAIIIYPSLMTPQILIGKDYIQLLLVYDSSQSPLVAENVNWQLKIEDGLDPRKPYTAGPLFTKNVDGYIKLKSYPLNDAIIKTPKQFRGILDKRIIKFYKDKGYDTIYGVNVTNTRIKKKGMYNLSWSLFKTEGPTGSTLNVVQDDGKIVVVGCSRQDELIQELMLILNGKKIFERGKYGFKVSRSDPDVRIAEVDYTNPVQSYHPIFAYEEMKQIGVGHVADTHISSRQNLLTKSKARVIEYETKDSNGNKIESDFGNSPEIGPMVSISSQNLKTILDKFGGYSAVDMVVIPGDLIDYIRGVYLGDIKDTSNKDVGKLKSFDDYKPSIAEIWKKVEIKGNVKDRYHRYIDYLTFYSLVIYFYREYHKPMYVVTGNHDCYKEPYAISPRVLKIVRANEGIPADHNLTIYEAILIFGETYHRVGEKEFGDTFNKEEFLWFYGVLTPFSDFLINFSKHCLVGMAWGDEEDVLGIAPWDWGQGFAGHLPRSDLAVSDKQLELLQKAFKLKKKLLLLTHFTFVSYREDVDFSNKEQGDVEFDTAWDAGVHDWGTFETNRKIMYEEYLVNQRAKLGAIHVIFSGHSHRRGVYYITKADYWGDNSVLTYVSDYYKYNPDYKYASPAIIVCDSAGPLPRISRNGEFGGWGSDAPSGSAAVFNSSGTLHKIYRVSALKPASDGTKIPNNPKPRFVVALDYQDIIADDDVILKFETEYFNKKNEQKGKARYAFEFSIPKSVWKLVWVKRIMIYAKPAGATWRKIELVQDKPNNRWVIPSGYQSEVFFNDIATIGSRSIFASIKFEGHDWKVKHYDFDSWWNFEVQIEPDGPFFGGDDKQYLIKRNKKRAEIPHFPWRKKLGKYK